MTEFRAKIIATLCSTSSQLGLRWQWRWRCSFEMEKINANVGFAREISCFIIIKNRYKRRTDGYKEIDLHENKNRRFVIKNWEWVLWSLRRCRRKVRKCLVWYSFQNLSYNLWSVISNWCFVKGLGFLNFFFSSNFKSSSCFQILDFLHSSPYQRFLYLIGIENYCVDAISSGRGGGKTSETWMNSFYTHYAKVYEKRLAQ